MQLFIGIGKYLTKTILFSFIMLGILFSYGCFGPLLVVGAGTGAVTYVQGNLTRTFENEYTQCVEASRRALKDLQFRINNQTADGLKTVLHGVRGDETPVTIGVEKENSRITTIAVRTGYLGYFDRDTSEKILQLIQKHLSISPVAESGRTIILEDTAKKRGVSVAGEKNENEKSPADATPFPQNPLYIYYQSSEVHVPVSAYANLNKLATHLIDHSELRLQIRCYTDAGGKKEERLQVSKQRADNLQNYFIVKGVARKRLTAQGYGATNFIVSNKTEKLRTLNRRAELELIE